jgi:hypothetical protein
VYTARIAPAQLGNATLNRYSSPAATGTACSVEPDLLADMGIHVSIGSFIHKKGCMSGCAATELQLPAFCKSAVNAG